MSQYRPKKNQEVIRTAAPQEKPSASEQRTASASRSKRHGSASSRARQKAARRRKRNRRKFLFGYQVYCAVLVILCFVIFLAVYQTMKEYEHYTPKNFVSASLQSLSDSRIEQSFTLNPDYEKGEDLTENVRAFFSDTDNYSVRQTGSGVYTVKNNIGNEIATVRVEVEKSVNKLGLLNYDILELKSIGLASDAELFHQTIKVPSDYTVRINGITASPSSSESLEGFADGGDYVDLPQVDEYEISGLTRKPDIIITDKNGNEADFEEDKDIDLSEAAGDSGQRFDSLAEAGCDFDALTFGEEWSLFLTADLSGSLYGYYNLANAYFIPDSQMDQKAYDWATGIDITFVSNHQLESVPFTDEAVTNVIKYNDNAISVDVYFNKNMYLTKSGQPRIDTFNSTLYLVQYEGEWKVVNIRGLSNESG